MRVILREALEDKKNPNKSDFIYEVIDTCVSSCSFLLVDHTGNFFKAPMENYVMLKEMNDYCV